MLLGIIYFIIAGVIFTLVIINLRLSDRVEELKKDNQYRFKEYCKEKEENKQNQEFIERIKENLPF